MENIEIIEKIRQFMMEEFEVEEIIVTTMTYSQEDRLRSFELLANAFELTD